MSGPELSPTTTATGKTGYISPQYEDVAARAGGHRATEGELVEAQHQANLTAEDEALRQKFEGGSFAGSMEGQIAPQAAGLARGLSLGLSDQALLHAAELLGGPEARESVRRRLKDYQTYAPFHSTMGEVGGVVAGTLAGDELALGGAPGLVGKLGRAVEGGIVGGIGEGSAAARVAGRVVGGVASGATEGALYGAGKAASDAAIENESLTGEKLVAGASHGALFGGVAGGALSGLGAVGRELVSGLRAPAREGAEGIAAGSPRGSIADQIEKTADVKTIKALGGSAGDLRTLEANVPGGFRKVAQDIRADVEATTGKSIGFQSRESLHDYATKRVDELGDKLGGMLRKLDDAKTGEAPSPAAFTQSVRNDIIGPKLIAKADGTLVTMPGQEKPVAAVEKWLGRIEDAFGDRPPTFEEWQKIRVGLDKEIYQGAAKASPKVEALRDMRAAMEGELMKSGERAAASMGESFQAEYQATKSLYQSVKKAAELTERGVSRDLANNSFGLTSRIAGTVMGAAGGVLGGPVGGVISGTAAALAGKVVQSRGDQLAADLLGRVATIAGARRLASKVTAQVEREVSTLIPANDNHVSAAIGFAPPARAAAAPLGIKLSGDRRADYAKISNTVAAASANPQATTERIAQSLGDLSEHSPGTATAAIKTTLAGVAFLASKLPPSRIDQYSLQPQLQPRNRASDAEISKFMHYAEAVDDPIIVLREAKSGTLTRDHVEAVKAVYPQLYDEMRANVMRNLIDSKSALPYGKRIQLGILLDIPTDKTLSPEFLRAIQATYSGAEKAGAESPPPNIAPPDIAGSAQTATQMAIERAA